MMNIIIDQLSKQDFQSCFTTVNKFLQENEKQKSFPKEYLKLFITILNSLKTIIVEQENKEFKFKLFQVLRLLTRSQDVSLNVQSQEFILLIDLMQIIQKQTSQSFTMMQIENLSIQKRLIYFNNKLLQTFNSKYVHSLLDIMTSSSKDLKLSLLDYIKLAMEIDGQLIQTEISSLYYVGKMLVLLENNDLELKIQTANLITKLLDCYQFSENFRKLTGMATVIQEIEKKDNDKLEVKIPLLNLLMRISSDSKNYTDLKLYGIVEILLQNLDHQEYMIVTTVINIFGQLSFDDELSSRIAQKGLQKIINLVFMCHPHRVKQLKFIDINKKDYPKAILELQIYTFRLLRYLASLNRHRHIFKQLFIPRLLQQFIDIENFNKTLNAYKKLVDDFNQIEPEDLLCMQETLQQSAENFYMQNTIKKIGNYEILEQIGKGAFGSVYLCRLGGNFYAIKQINDVETLQYREVQIHLELNHPNIVKLYECFIYEHSLCLVIEYIKGMNVQELIKLMNEKNQQIEEENVWKILIDLLSVLRYLHFDKNIVHRDLNPANIMVDSSYSIKICDFGLAKHFQEDIINNSFVGTLIYTCPQIVENKAYSEKADVWALGCVLYEMLQQKPAFQSANPLMLAKKIVQLEYEPINQGIYSNELINIVQLCLQKEEDKRPSVNELLEMISLKMVILMDTIKQEKDDLKSELQDLQSKINDQQYEIKKEQQEPGLQVWNIFQKLLQLSLHDYKTLDAKNQYLIEQFRRKISKPDNDINIQTELTKLTSLSKEFISYLPKITYEQLFFIIETECKSQQI
ncbi:unnamed protein product [Paramecium octaurelia]|uniref:Protein kinase domain-containing protein n=1 Tax=Paramecium octaurelia TaxID=43137 RepID=A0A8S1S785_PAROT|nr:unnamed protein product [Paramecium octaurelia]